MPVRDEEEDETEDNSANEALSGEVTSIIEDITAVITKVEEIDCDDLKRRYTRRLDKAKNKLEVAKDTLEVLVELLED